MEYLSSDLPAAPQKKLYWKMPMMSVTHLQNTASRKMGASQSAEFFARDLVVTEDENLGLEKTTERVAEAAGVFLTSKKEAVYKKNIFEKLYPASTTKY